MTNNKSNTGKKRTRRTNIRHAVEEAISTLMSKNKNKIVSAKHVIKYLEEYDETGHIVDNKDCHLVWRDTKGKYHEVTHKSITNMVSIIKNTS